MTEDAVEVVDAELVNDDHLPAIVAPAPNARPTVDRHTIPYPGQSLPTQAHQPTYTKRDLYVCERTRERLENQSAPKNTSANYRSQPNQFAAWCTEQGRVARPCTTATYVEYVAHLIGAGRSPKDGASAGGGIVVAVGALERLAFQACVEARAGGVVGAGADCAHRASDAQLPAQIGEFPRSVLLRFMGPTRSLVRAGAGRRERRYAIANVSVGALTPG